MRLAYALAFSVFGSSPLLAADLSLPGMGDLTPSYWAKFPTMSAWTDPKIFPLGVWCPPITSQSDINEDKALSLNSYFCVTGGSDLSLIRQNGMYVILQQEQGKYPYVPGWGSETIAWLHSDEIESLGTGSDPWNGKATTWGNCLDPNKHSCSFSAMATIQSKFPTGRPFYANFGTAVWAAWNPDSEAAKYFNGTGGWSGTDFASVDVYAYSYSDLCLSNQAGAFIKGTGPIDAAGGISLTPSECHRSSTYGAVIDRVRKLDLLDGKAQPILGFVETGHPMTDEKYAPISAPQIQGAVMSEIIHGARGIIYFTHSFAGPCINQYGLRNAALQRPECKFYTAQRDAVGAINAHIKQLAPMLNTGRLKWDFRAPTCDAAIWQNAGAVFIAVQQNRGDAGQCKLTLPPALASASATVVNWQGKTTSTVPVAADGTITVAFNREWEWREILFGAPADLPSTSPSVPTNPPAANPPPTASPTTPGSVNPPAANPPSKPTVKPRRYRQQQFRRMRTGELSRSLLQ